MNHIRNREYLTEIDLYEPDYSFDLLGLWRDEQGFYLGTDSGCSCPTPWESHTAEDLTGPLTLDQTLEEATSLWVNAGKYQPEEFKAFIRVATESFMTTVDTTRRIKNSFDVPYEGPLAVTDANGVKWTRTDAYGDFTSEAGVESDQYALNYPLTVIEEEN